jgi:hypothetical protein
VLSYRTYNLGPLLMPTRFFTRPDNTPSPWPAFCWQAPGRGSFVAPVPRHSHPTARATGQGPVTNSKWLSFKTYNLRPYSHWLTYLQGRQSRWLAFCWQEPGRGPFVAPVPSSKLANCGAGLWWQQVPPEPKAPPPIPHCTYRQPLLVTPIANHCFWKVSFTGRGYDTIRWAAMC